MCNGCARLPITVADMELLVRDLVDREMARYARDEGAAVGSVSASAGLPVADLRRLFARLDVGRGV